MSITVINLMREPELVAGSVYIGRRNRWRGLAASPLANPFKVEHEIERDEEIARYRDWLHERIVAGDRAVLDELALLASIVVKTGSLRLACYCAPSPCHGDVVKAAILEVLRDEVVA